MSSIESVEQKIDSHEAECLRHRNVLIGRIEKIEADIDSIYENKVSYQHFYWIIGTLLGIEIIILGYIAHQNNSISQKVEDTNKSVVSTQVQVSELRGKLDPYDVQYQK